MSPVHMFRTAFLQSSKLRAPVGAHYFSSTVTANNKTVLVEHVDQVAYIKLNRPASKNSFDAQMLEETADALDASNANPKIGLTVLTGTGSFFTSGNDQNNFKLWTNKPDKEMREGIAFFMNRVDRLIKSCIDFRKPIFIAANGPGVGIGLTVLGLVDYVVCTDDSWFWAPFTTLGLSPEFCSSYTFPKLIGNSRTSQALLLSHRVTAQEALDWGLVSKVVPRADFDNYLREWIHGEKGVIKSFSLESMQASKALIKNDAEVAKLHEVAEVESKVISERFLSDWANNYAMKFLAKQK